MQNIKAKNLSVRKIEWKQPDKQMDVQTGGGDCITSSANEVGNSNINN